MEDGCIEEEEQDVSTPFLQTQKNHFIVLQNHMKNYSKVLPVSGFNSAKCYINLKRGFYYLSSLKIKGLYE